MKNFLKKTLRNIIAGTIKITAIACGVYGSALAIQTSIENFGVTPTAIGFVAVLIVIVSVIAAIGDNEE